MRTLARQLSVGVLALTILGVPASARQSPPASADTTTLVVLFNGARIGTESASVSKDGSGWTISTTGRLLPPFDLTISKFEMHYASDWQPRDLTIEGTLRGQPLSLSTTFGLTTATNDLTEGQQHVSNTQSVSPRTIVLPNAFFASYEALAARLATSAVGTRLPVYIAPASEVMATVTRVTPQRIDLPTRAVDVREFTLTLADTHGPVPMEVWVDADNRLARLVIPTSSIVVIRDDLASVMAREDRAHNATDETLFIPANGFTLGSTITTPARAPARAPAVVLVSTSGPQDRDWTTFGVPVAGQLAGALAARGYVVVRYDGRGVGQSGGRTENATIAEYADDALRVVSWLKKRKDVDGDRIALVGYADAGPVALTAARDGSVKAVVLVAAPGVSGRQLTLDEQQRALAGLHVSDAERASDTTAEQRIINAAIGTGTWDGISTDARRSADTPWFKSWLLFDPTIAMKDLRQPLLIVDGSLDTAMPPTYADALESIARARKNAPPAFTEKVIVSGVNHLLVPAMTGDANEFSSLADRTLSPDVVNAIATWLDRIFKAR